MGKSGGCAFFCLLFAKLVDGDAPQWTQFHGWSTTNFEQCKWADCLKSCFLFFPHFGDGDTPEMQRRSEVCNRPSQAAALKLRAYNLKGGSHSYKLQVTCKEKWSVIVAGRDTFSSSFLNPLFLKKKKAYHFSCFHSKYLYDTVENKT